METFVNSDPGWGENEENETRSLLRTALLEDHATEDRTSILSVPEKIQGKVVLRNRKQGVLAGIRSVAICFEELGVDAKIKQLAGDGQLLEAASTILEIEAPLRGILAAERNFLNLMGFLSGTATLTAEFVAAVGNDCKILDTRKTFPGARVLQKYAVRCGGGMNHRLHLADGILLKDNHRFEGLVLSEMVAAARSRWPQTPVIVEVDTLDQLKEVLQLDIDRVLLDNFKPAGIIEAKAMRDEAAAKIGLEVSGGVNLQSAASLAQAGAEFLSIGALTHSVTTLDLGLDLLDAS